MLKAICDAIFGVEMDQDGLMEILKFLAFTIISAIMSVFAKYFNAKANDIKSSKKNCEIMTKMQFIEDTVEKVVVGINQSYVNELKKSGEFDDEAKSQAFSLALDQLNEILSVPVRAAVEEYIGDFSQYLSTIIEQKISIACNKTENKTVCLECEDYLENDIEEVPDNEKKFITALSKDTDISNDTKEKTDDESKEEYNDFIGD